MSEAAADRTCTGNVIDVEEVERLAGWAARYGPAWLRAEMRSEARLRVLEALDEGYTSGLGRVAYRGAMGALRAAAYQAGPHQSRSAMESAVSAVRLGALPEFGDERLQVPWSVPDGVSNERGLGPVFDRVVTELAARGVDADQVTEALWTLADAAGQEAPRNRPAVFADAPSSVVSRARVHDSSLVRMAAQSGLSVPQCAALKVLIIGERARPERGKPSAPGLLARLTMGEDAWSDPRVERILAYIALPSGALRCAWSGVRTARSPLAVS